MDINNPDKLKPRSISPVFMGYSLTQKEYILINLTIHLFLESMDVIFQEADFSFSSSTTNPVSVYTHLNPIVLDDELFSGRNHDVNFDKSIEY